MYTNTVSPAPVAALADRYRSVRRQSEILCEPLLKEDYNLQAMPEVSPSKWHLAHASWFFECFVLKAFAPGYAPFNPDYDTLFNSYYLSVGAPYPRERRGLLTRPTIGEVFEYRRVVDERVLALLAHMPAAKSQIILQRVELGLQHEQQHQELILTDIKYNFYCNPLLPAYTPASTLPPARRGVHAGARKIEWIEFQTGIAPLGADAGSGFCFDNETPRHRVFLHAYALADRPVSNGEFLQFIEDGGYNRPELWLADGWQKVQQLGWRAPLYWQQMDNRWQIYTLHGLQPFHAADPVCHISYYEADAYARWAGARLPTEAEWENAAATQEVEGNFLCDAFLQPRASCPQMSGLRQLFGDVWEWTASAYAPYPGFAKPVGAIGEYNGKFMCNQMVLRGGSCVSERAHLRASYRNFFYPTDRWQFSGVRLAYSQPHAWKE